MTKGSNNLSMFSWAMYDFANTIFAMNVISLYFALWVTIDKAGEDILYSIAISGSMLFAAASAPILGAVSDRIQRKMPFLIGFTIVCCICTALIGIVHNLLFGLILFAIANYCFQLGDVFYNSLLPIVSNGKRIGRVSGYGTSLGYVGTIVGLILVSPFVIKYGRQAAFIPTGIFFLLFALPCFVFVRDRKQFHNRKLVQSEPIVKAAFFKIKTTIINIKQYAGLLRFLVAGFIALNAINTVFIFMSVYVKKIGGFSGQEIIFFYIICSIFAILGAFFAGFITDLIGAKKTFTGVLMLWCLGAVLAIISFHKLLFWVIGPFIGITLGGTWTSARVLIVNLSPSDMYGEIFGFYGLIGKTATIIGPLIWGAVVWGFGSLGLIKYRIAVFILLLFLISALIIMRKVPEVKND